MKKPVTHAPAMEMRNVRSTSRFSWLLKYEPSSAIVASRSRDLPLDVWSKVAAELARRAAAALSWNSSERTSENATMHQSNMLKPKNQIIVCDGGVLLNRCHTKSRGIHAQTPANPPQTRPKIIRQEKAMTCQLTNKLSSAMPT